MSRSYKKNVWFTDNGPHRKFQKKRANKRVRKSEEIPSGNAFKKYFNSWDICDWKFEWRDSFSDPFWKARKK
jgi:hypothetical protein